MIVEIDTKLKLIIIEEADGEELKGLVKRYPNYYFTSKIVYQNAPLWSTTLTTN